MIAEDSRFVVIMPCFNAESTILKSLLSVISQSYVNWKVIIRDDMSTDRTREIIDGVINVFGLQDKIIVETNTEKKWEVKNILEMLSLENEVTDQDIICRLDGDDWLTELDAFAILNSVYQSTKADVVWTAHRWGFSDKNISGPMPKDADPYNHPWVSSHFKTFRKRLINEVDEKNFKNEEGDYFKRIGDQAIYLPVLKNAKGNWHFEPRVMYHYTIDNSPETFHTPDAVYQKNEAEYLRKRGYIE